jgi:hypothetical protein
MGRFSCRRPAFFICDILLTYYPSIFNLKFRFSILELLTLVSRKVREVRKGMQDIISIVPSIDLDGTQSI